MDARMIENTSVSQKCCNRDPAFCTLSSSHVFLLLRMHALFLSLTPPPLTPSSSNPHPSMLCEYRRWRPQKLLVPGATPDF